VRLEVIFTISKCR